MSDHKTPHQLEREHIQELAKIKADENVILAKTDLIRAKANAQIRALRMVLFVKLMSLAAGLGVLIIMAHYHLSYWMVLVAILFLAVNMPGTPDIDEWPNPTQPQGE